MTAPVITVATFAAQADIAMPRVTEDIDALVRLAAVAIEPADLPYLLAGIRRGRLNDPVRRSDTLRRIDRIRQQHEHAEREIRVG